ncbi:MAG: capsid protein [Mesorhizobium sp.]|nr:capsid protein [Mesorhizobium sp.]TGT94373.1 capsid protein [Mesorhizobium sp. M5C.F.Ca.ET.164.01.1.1]RWB31200.1 MAG: capsid protein [Mesorhizobium sp.]RWB35235.1 MAG: capsid protein [Mesorhizobium sp.]RWC23998.1 MAG: capsid protein [Mesorhizobium sp.]RWC34000.1 MAG: capsid protein [Mesorhizobium sp.]
MARMKTCRAFGVAVTPSPRTLRAELLRLCARIGYSPPTFP